MTSKQDASNDTATVDLREQLFNGGLFGSIKTVQLSTERIMQVRGVLYDIDPRMLLQSSILPEVPTDPKEFYIVVAEPWISRHDVLRKAEIRSSGRGLHAILWFDAPVILETEGEQDRWAGIIQAVQAALPTDPDAPGITALTRPIGSLNGKNGAQVELLYAGEPVSADEVLSLYQDMCNAPFRTVMRILTGSDRLTPCPLCKKENSTLAALNQKGSCYSGCGSVKLERLYDLVLAHRTLSGEGQADAAH